MKLRTMGLLLAVTMGIVSVSGCQKQSAAASEAVTEEKEVTIYLVRHGKTFLNTTGQVQGWVDSPLTEDGEAQADAVGRGMKDISFTAAFSSDLGRQRATAKHILDQNTGIVPELQEVIGLREWFYGGFEGKMDSELWRPIYEAHGAVYDEKSSQYLKLSKKEIADTIASIDPQHAAESYSDISKRTIEAMDTIVKNTQAAGGGNALAISSGDEIVTILELLVPGQYQGEHISNCSVTTLEYQNGVYTLKTCGDTSYLEIGKQ